jgi:hypothetical protein
MFSVLHSLNVTLCKHRCLNAACHYGRIHKTGNHGYIWGLATVLPVLKGQNLVLGRVLKGMESNQVTSGSPGSTAFSRPSWNWLLDLVINQVDQIGLVFLSIIKMLYGNRRQ